MTDDYHGLNLRIYISYHPNDRSAADLVRQHVLAWGHRVWMDVYDLTPDSPDPAADRYHALERADVVIVLESRDYRDQDGPHQPEEAWSREEDHRITIVIDPDLHVDESHLVTLLDLEHPEAALEDLRQRLAQVLPRDMLEMVEFPMPELSEDAPAAPADEEEEDTEITGAFRAPPPAPQPAPAYAKPERKEAARRERAKKESEREAAPPTAAEPPQFTAFYPQVVKPAQAYALMVFAHLDAARGRVQEIAAGYAPMMGGAQASGSAPSKLQIDPGSLITVVPQVAGITFEPAEQVIAWQPPHVSATFLFSTPETLTRDISGRVLIYHGPLIAGEIPITPVTIKQPQGRTAPTPPLNQEAPMQVYDPVFASYSHRDTPVMEYFRRARANIGQRMLVDIYDLRAGEHWADRLLEMIEESAVFQLFWSANSAQSPYCRQEWEHALKYIDARPRFVQPVYWSGPGPAPTPPPELAGLHFQRVTLPPLTRVQLAVAKVRAALRGG